MSRLEIGSPAPAFTLPTAGGDAVSLSDYLGRKVIVYFLSQSINSRLHHTGLRF